MNVYLYIANQKLSNVINLDTLRRNDFRGYHFFLLKKSLEQQGNFLYDLKEHENEELPKESVLIFSNFPKHDEVLLSRFRDLKKILILSESEYIRPDNYELKNHSHIDVIFTWKDELVDNNKYFKFWYPNKIPTSLPEIGCRNGFCTMIAMNKFARNNKFHNLGLYKERIRLIKWFERYYPNEFDLYGMGWDRGFFTNRIMRKLNRFDRLMKSKLMKPHYPSYRGSVSSKYETLSKYKFAICFENAFGIKNYITEKIFDCFFSGTIPIYYGAPDVGEQIPESTFIDRRNFDSYEDLFYYLKNLSEEDYQNYFNSILRYLKSDRIQQHSSEALVAKLLHVLSDNS